MSSKPKVLIFIDWFLPGYKAGGPVTSNANMINHLCHCFDFYVVTRNTDYQEAKTYTGITPNQWTKAHNAHIMYLSNDNINLGTYKKILSQEQFHFVFINGIYSFKFSILPLWAAKQYKSKIIISARGMLAESAINIKGAKKKFYLNFAKAIGLYTNCVFHATNSTEKGDIQKIFGLEKPVRIAPNLFEHNHQKPLKERVKNPGNLKIVSVARIAPEKNLHFAIECLKEIKTPVEFDVFGPVYNPEYFEQCKRVANTCGNNIKISFKGPVEPEKINDTLNKYHLMFLPTLGENFGHIILQSLSAGTPVLISDKTPWNNLELQRCGAEISLEKRAAFAAFIEKANAWNQPAFNQWSLAAWKRAREYIEDKSAIDANKALFL